MLRPDFDAAVDFLHRFRLGGPWVVTSIQTSGVISTVSVTSEQELRRWLINNQGSNCYFSVNPTIRPVTSKPKREDVLSLDFLHVDIDPNDWAKLSPLEQKRFTQVSEYDRRAAYLAAEVERIRLSLEKFDPAPTVVLFSGGGYQAFWRLKEPVTLDGNLEACESAALYNLALNQKLGGDKCQNVDRVMRLPGTINWPNAGKLAKGRQPAVAYVVSWADHDYDIDTFPRAVQSTAPDARSYAVELSGNIPVIDSIDHDSLKRLSADTKSVITTGTLKGAASRSEALFRVCTDMVRASCDDDVIYAVITSPHFAISESVRSKTNRAHTYALRQISRAREMAIHHRLAEFNDRYAVVKISGKVKVVEAVTAGDVIDYEFISPRDLITFYGGDNVEVHGQTPAGKDKTEHVNVAKWWLTHPQHAKFSRFGFFPGRHTADTYNTWQGFGVEPIAGECGLFLSHIRESLCSNDDAIYSYVLAWMASCVQRPDYLPGTAIAIKGDQGTGKSLFAKAFGRLFGRHYFETASPDHITGRFNSAIADCIFAFADEAFCADDKAEAVLKQLITSDRITIERKGVDVTTVPNYLHLMLASNNDRLLNAGVHERRWLVLEASNVHRQDGSYFEPIMRQMENGGYQALLHYLMNYDVSGVDLRNVPRTEGLRKQQALNMDIYQSWWLEVLQNGYLVEGNDWRECLPTSEVNYSLKQFADHLGDRTKRSMSMLKLFLAKALPAEWRLESRKAGIDGLTANGDMIPCSQKQVRVCNLPPLDICRSTFDARFSGPYSWPEADEPPTQLEMTR